MLDFLLIFRDSAQWNTPPESFSASISEDSSPSLFRIAFNSLAHPSSAVRAVAAEGIAKLLTAGRFRGAARAEGETLIAAALLHFVEDAAADGGELSTESVAMQQCLAVFFAGFSGRHPSNAAAIARAVVPAVRHALHAPPASRLARVGATHLGQYLLSLLEPAEQAVGAPTELAASASDAAYTLVAKELLLELEASTDDAPSGRHLAKILHAIPLVALGGGKPTGYGTVLGLAGRALEAVKDGATRTALSKFIQAVGDTAASAAPEDASPAPSTDAIPPPVAEGEHEEALRRAVHGPVAALFTPPGVVVATPARARKPSAGGTVARKKKAAASPAVSTDGDGPMLRRSGR